MGKNRFCLKKKNNTKIYFLLFLIFHFLLNYSGSTLDLNLSRSSASPMNAPACHLIKTKHQNLKCIVIKKKKYIHEIMWALP